jgi:hypothetical protein
MLLATKLISAGNLEFFPMIFFCCLMISTIQLFLCRQKYNEFVLCLRKTEGDESACAESRQLATSICPTEWVRNVLFLSIQKILLTYFIF